MSDEKKSKWGFKMPSLKELGDAAKEAGEKAMAVGKIAGEKAMEAGKIASDKAQEALKKKEDPKIEDKKEEK